MIGYVADKRWKPPPTAQSVNESRISWIDTARGFAIFLVVYGHVIRGLVHSHLLDWTDTTRFVDAWIYTFHMPLFFFLSGLLLYHSLQRPWRAFVFTKLRTIAYPYFIWSAITLLIKAALDGLTNHPHGLFELPSIVYRPIDQFWFLYILFILSIAVSALLKLGVKPWAIFVLAIVAYATPLPNTLSWGIVDTRKFAIYLALGVALGWDRNLRRVSAINAA